ncbi:putative F-box/LRR-repeat protein-like [Capsicum annuum]|nr:putative F-box/LRR-repeat protein-like [Capsicum annuum]
MSHSDSSQSESENVGIAYVDQCYGDKTVNKPDRLSALPDHLLLHIFSSFQMKDVIITRVLSKRWHLLWTSAHNLCFNHSLESNRDVTEFIKSIDDTLILSKPSKLKKFSIEFLYRNNQFVDNVNKWMIFVTIKSVEGLDLNLMRGSKEGYSLPQLMYSNVRLHKLKLSNCNLVPKEGINWPVLRVLSLWYAKLSLEVVDVICSGCPDLESLKFYSDDDDDDDKELTIWARNVTLLEISGWFHKKIPVLQNVQALVDAKLYFFEFRTNQKMLNDLLASLGHVEKLSIGPWCLQV